MRIVLAPDKFKECLAAPAVVDAMAEGLRAAWASGGRDPHGLLLERVPLADGGEGTVDALVAATGGSRHRQRVPGPLGDPVDAEFGILGDGVTAVIEMAAASGLALVERARRRVLDAHTRGTGMLIQAALDRGVRKVILGIGGSATNDGGAGLADALGYRLLDDAGNPIEPGGGSLHRLARIDARGADPRLAATEFLVACDVRNPLTGPEGASAVYGPQKGASAAQVAELDANLAHFAAIVRRDVKDADPATPGAGAAGGLGFGLLAFAHARLEPGIDLVMDAVRLDERLRGADYCVTGEGALDQSSRFGKTVAGVTRVARLAGVPVIALAGTVRPEAAALYEDGLLAILSTTPAPCSLDEALAKGAENVTRTAAALGRLLFAQVSGPSARA